MSETTVTTRRLDSTRSEQIAERTLLLAATAELRDDFMRGAARAQELHEDVELDELERNARSLELESTPELLEALVDVGFSWATIARLLDITPTAVRKWRKGAGVTASNHQRLAHLLATARMLTRVQPRIDDVAFWLETPCREDTALLRLDLYRAKAYNALLALAAERRQVVELLDEVLPDWRRLHGRDARFELVWADDDGAPLIVMRGADG
jgi:transposase-like protein